MNSQNYKTDVFINCPFDPEYKDFFYSIVFTIYDCGFRARCALEESNSGNVRIDKIFKIIKKCKFGIHDISRTELNEENLPRFNMPLELGMFLGGKYFGDKRQKNKICLILDREKYRYQKYISDISGQDIMSHDGKSTNVIQIIRDWLSSSLKGKNILYGSEKILERYNDLKKNLPEYCKKLGFVEAKLDFNDYTQIVSCWLEINEPEQIDIRKTIQKTKNKN